ncbi:MAG: hypothetical protein LBS20_10150, partial [Prevotella sp.]|nr:hypothetical protein [Prevotella sp.]
RIIIHIQPVPTIQLLIIILVRLLILPRSIRKRHTERIILRTLNHRCRCIGYYPVVTQMVGDVKVIISSFIITTID